MRFRVGTAAAATVVLGLGVASTPGQATSAAQHHQHHDMDRSSATSTVAAPRTVTVANMQFTPSVVGVTLGETVTWRFPEALGHTTSSDQGFWDSQSRSNGATYVRAFTSAGKFAYHCSIHPSMRAAVRVPLTATLKPAGWTLRWSTVNAGAGISFDVQTRRGSRSWKNFRSDTAKAKGRFDPARTGTYKIRARTSKGAARSGWSPVTVITVS